MLSSDCLRHALIETHMHFYSILFMDTVHDRHQALESPSLFKKVGALDISFRDLHKGNQSRAKHT